MRAFSLNLRQMQNLGKFTPLNLHEHLFNRGNWIYISCFGTYVPVSPPSDVESACDPQALYSIQIEAKWLLWYNSQHHVVIF